MVQQCCNRLERELLENNFKFLRLSDSEFKIQFSDSVYFVFVYMYSVNENELGVSLRGEYGINLYDYVSASQGVPMGEIKDRTENGIVNKVVEDLITIRSDEE